MSERFNLLTKDEQVEYLIDLVHAYVSEPRNPVERTILEYVKIIKEKQEQEEEK